MKHDDESLDRIYMRTNGRCHICRKQLARRSHGNVGERGAWEVDHSVPRSKGGRDHGNNFFPACVPCNRSKSNSSSARARAEHGYTRSPYSPAEREANTLIGGGIGLLLALLVPPPVRIGAAIVFGLIGAVVGNDLEPD